MVLHSMIKITDFLIEKISPSKLDPIGLGQAYWKFWRGVMKNPGELMAQNIQLAADQVKLLSYGLKKASGKDPEVVAVSEKGDRRFKDPAWSEQLMFDMLRQSYLLTSQYTMKLIGSGDLDEKQQHKVDFFTRQMVDAMSPANFAVTNPEVLKATIDSKGVNLVKGMKNLVHDLVEGKGQLKISMVDKSKFEVGKNIASTPGKVVYQNEMMQLIQYTPTTDKVYKRPLVIYPPWINKFYILDLSPKNSFIQWAVSKGYTVFVVS
jgi:poly[(R)-3-hydroxyalkanoate] polymerase subunit PhaC